MKRAVERIGSALLAGPLLLLLTAAAPAEDAAQVRERRLAYGAAISARQAEAMRGFLAADMVQLSSNGQMQAGRDTVVASYAAAEFVDPSFIAYERIPDTVDISANGRFAVERGHWRGRFRQPDGSITGNSGLYQAGWIKRDGVWLIRTESYVRLTCASESDCPR
ncbi:MAG: nuclear transport factor 2 family protein [Alphaproteobacteria bacterium]|nr:nuclear transport factor 2 family protein [Alphaproteobacteria bacterium]